MTRCYKLYPEDLPDIGKITKAKVPVQVSSAAIPAQASFEAPDFVKVMNTLAANLKVEREKRGLSLKDIARRSGLSTATINLMETNKRCMPNITSLWAIANALGVCPASLLGFKGYWEEV